MSIKTARRTSDFRKSWHGMAFLVEALFLLVFISGSVAVFFNLFATSGAMGNQSAELTRAITMASNEAEKLAADPMEYAKLAPVETACDDLTAVAVVTKDKGKAGTMYNAEILVYRTSDYAAHEDGSKSVEPVYTLGTCRYVSEVR